MTTSSLLLIALLPLFVATEVVAEIGLARLSFWIPPERKAEFEEVYRSRLKPILGKYGLEESPTVDPESNNREGIFTRVLRASPAALPEKRLDLSRDESWRSILETFGAEEVNLSRDTRGWVRDRFLLSVWRASGKGRAIEAGPGRGQWKTYETGGKSMLRDRDGNLWFGDKGEVRKFDGVGWTRYGPEDGLRVDPSNSIHAIYQTSDGALWFGAHNAVTRFDGASWTAYESERIGSSVRCMVEVDSELWIGARQDIYVLKDGNFRHPEGMPDFGVVRALRKASDGSVWAATVSRGLFRLKDSGWHRFTTDHGLPSNAVSSLSEDVNGRLYASTANGLAVYDGVSWQTLDGDQGSIGDVGEVHVDRGNVVWVSVTTPRRIGKFDGTWRWYDQDDATDGAIHRIIEDPEGFMWFSGRLGRASRYDEHLLTFTEDDGLPEAHITALCEDRQGNIWVGMRERGVVRYDGRTFHQFTEADGLSSNAVSSLLLDSDENVWFGTRGGLTKWDGKTFQTFGKEEGVGAPGSLSATINALIEDSGGAIWAGGLGFSTRYDGKTWTSMPVPEDLELYGAHVQGFGHDRDGHLISAWGAGVAKLTPGGWEPVYDFDLTPGRYRTILKDRMGNLWLGTYGSGVLRLGDGDVISYRIQQGLASNFVNAMHEDRMGVLWLGSGGSNVVGSGVSRFDGEVFQTLTQEDGLAHDHVTALLGDRAGRVWIGTRRGLTRYRQPKIVPPRVAIESVVADRRHPGRDTLSVTSTTVTFEYDAISLKTRREAMTFRYKLHGHDPDWRNTRSRRVEYEDLDTGEYRFEVIAVDRDLIRSAIPATVSLFVTPDYNKIAWMSASGLFLLLTAWQTSRVVLRDRRLRESNRALSDANNELFQVNLDLQREQVLERLRGQAQGMLSSEDIGPLVKAVYDELTALGLPLTNSGIAVHITDETSEIWVTTEDGHPVPPKVVRRPAEPQIREARRRGETYCHLHHEGQEVHDVFQKLIEIGHARWRDVPASEWPSRIDSYFVFFGAGDINVHAEQPITESDLDLIRRFGEVFGYAHSRYRELQEKEAQNRELRHQNVLERLRGMAQGMQSSEDIGGVVEAVYRELSELGLDLAFSGIDIVTPSGLEKWYVSDSGVPLKPFETPNRYSVEAIAARDRGDISYHRDIGGEELRSALRRTIEDGFVRWKDVPEDTWPTRLQAYYVFFEGGVVQLGSESAIDEDVLYLIKRFGEVFGYAHARHRELQQKEAQNRRLAVDAAVQRLRAEVQSMDEAGDFERILSFLTESLEQVELPFAGCEIDVLDEPVESPTMAQFEKDGFRYTTYTLAPDGSVASNAYALNAPFPTVNERAIQRFIEGEPWQGSSDDLRIVEVPAGSYGRLRLTASDRDAYTDDEIATLREFADAIALGYARYLDIKQLEDQNRRLNVERMVERVRAEATAMQRSEDIANVMRALYEGLHAAGLNQEACLIEVIDRERDVFEIYSAHDFTASPAAMATFPQDKVMQPDILLGVHLLHVTVPGSMIRDSKWFEHAEPAIPFGNYEVEGVFRGSREIPELLQATWGGDFRPTEFVGRYQYNLPYEYGGFSALAREGETFEEEDLETVRLFADAVTLGYARYLDFKELEEANREIQQQSERKSNFLAQIVHDLRSPMNAVKGFTNMILRRDPDLRDRTRENLEKVNRSSDHMLSLIDDLLDLSKIEAGEMVVEPQRFDVAEVIRDCCDMIEPLVQEGVVLKQEVAEDIGEANTDGERLRRMVVNLLSNAVKFTESGTITVTAERHSKAEEVDQYPSETGDQSLNAVDVLVVSVADTGRGIPEEELPTLFDEYRQVAGQSESAVQKGAGLGLSITKKFAELLGGTIEVESELGRGTTFTVAIPIAYGGD